MVTCLVAHGAWSAGWAWKKMRPLLHERGHELLTPTYTGPGERAHLARPDIDLETHIADVLGVLHCEDLRDVVLLGRSYGGMVATGVADRVPERLSQFVYLDALVPRNGQALLELTPNPPGGSARVPQPRKSFEQPLKLSGTRSRIPTTYIYCARPGPGDVFRRFAERARSKPGWQYREIDATHNPHITAPDTVARLLDSVVARGAGGA
jgi:pimeloyl-ACP methyl ester carboxylesterase